MYEEFQVWCGVAHSCSQYGVNVIQLYEQEFQENLANYVTRGFLILEVLRATTIRLLQKRTRVLPSYTANGSRTICC